MDTNNQPDNFEFGKLEKMDQNTKNILNSVVNYFSEYQEIIFKIFSTSQNMSIEINEIKKEIFEKYLITYHHEILENIIYIISTIQEKYKSKYFLAIADFVDLIYQNSFYDVFSIKFQEMELLYPLSITENHLMIFNLIVYVEHIKFKLYEQLELKTNNLNIKKTLEKRKTNSLLRINVCVNLLENYPSITNKDYDYQTIITKNGFFKKNSDYVEKFFKEIN